MVSYKDVSKPVDDILDKQFIHNKLWSVDLKHKLDNPSLKLSSQLGADGKLSCASSCGMNWGPVAVNGLLGIDGSAGLQVSYNSDLLRGWSLQSNVTSAIKTVTREQKIELQAKYNKDPWKVHALVNPVDQKWGVSLIGKHPLNAAAHTLTYGIDVCGDSMARPTVNGVGVGYTYPMMGHTISSAVTVTPHGQQPLGKVSFSVASQSPAKSELAVRYTYVPGEDRAELSAGAGWIIDPKTKLTSIKAKIDQNVNVSASLTHKLNDSASVTIGVALNGFKQASEADNSAKVGVKLSLAA